MYFVGLWSFKSVGHDFAEEFWIRAITWQQLIPLAWKTEQPVWVDEWPLTKEKLLHLHELVQEQLAAGHIVHTANPWNAPVFVTLKNSGKWRLLENLRAVSAVTEPMGVLHPGLPLPLMLPLKWPVVVIDLKDCGFFYHSTSTKTCTTIRFLSSLHQPTKPCSAISLDCFTTRNAQ